MPIVTLRGKLVPEILEVDVHVYLHGVEIFPELELPLGESQVELPVGAVPEDGRETVHEPEPDWSTLIGRGPSRLCSDWLRSWCCNASSLMPKRHS